MKSNAIFKLSPIYGGSWKGESLSMARQREQREQREAEKGALVWNERHSSDNGGE